MLKATVAAELANSHNCTGQHCYCPQSCLYDELQLVRSSGQGMVLHLALHPTLLSSSISNSGTPAAKAADTSHIPHHTRCRPSSLRGRAMHCGHSKGSATRMEHVSPCNISAGCCAHLLHTCSGLISTAHAVRATGLQFGAGMAGGGISELQWQVQCASTHA
jgi:hypothetical protein